MVDLSDAIAYAAHDLDDGLRAGLLHPEELKEVELLQALALEEGLDLLRLPELDRRVLVRQLLGYFITAAIEATHRRVEEAGVQSAEAVRRHPSRLAALGEEAEKALKALKAFLMERFYRHPEVLRERRKAEAVLEGLFAAYTRYPELLPREVQAKIPEEGLERAVCDYIAGMTDRFASGPTAGSPPKGPHPPPRPWAGAFGAPGARSGGRKGSGVDYRGETAKLVRGVR